PPQARLDPVCKQQYLVLPADFLGLLQKSRWSNNNPRLALNRLDQKRACIRSYGIAKSIRIAEGDDLESRRERPETVAILLVGREADHGRGAPVKVIGAHDDLSLAVSNALDLVAPLARSFDRSFYRFGSRVHGQRHVEAGQVMQ